MYSAISRGKFERDGKQKKLKHWVYAIAENEIRTFYTRFHNKPKSPGGSMHQEVLANLGTECWAKRVRSQIGNLGNWRLCEL